MTKKTIRAANALLDAQKIAFPPFVFQSSLTLKKFSVDGMIFNSLHQGVISIEEIGKKLSIRHYGLSVLLEFSASADIVSKSTEGTYELTKTGYILNYNKAVNVNLNFTHKICYKGLFHLDEAIETSKPSALKKLSTWDTIYEGLSQLTPKKQQSWFKIDHFYSDGIFEDALNRVFINQPKLLFEIGGHTGKFASQCFKYDEKINVKIIDFPGQLNKALKNLTEAGFRNRLSVQEIDWLKSNLQIPNGAYFIWMSQFLDCFTEDEILNILYTCVASMDAKTELIIIETFTDRQENPMSKFVLEATSLYFTVIPNGKSKMYSATVFYKMISEAGLSIKEELTIDEHHIMLICKIS